MTCYVLKHSPDSRKENMLSLLTGLGKGYFCILLSQIRPEGKVLSSQIARTRRGLQMCRWRDVIAGSSAPISQNRNLFSQNQQKIASTGKQIIMVGRPAVLAHFLSLFEVSCIDFLLFTKNL